MGIQFDDVSGSSMVVNPPQAWSVDSKCSDLGPALPGPFFCVRFGCGDERLAESVTTERRHPGEVHCRECRQCYYI